jgi:hypothetical protein
LEYYGAMRKDGENANDESHGKNSFLDSQSSHPPERLTRVRLQYRNKPHPPNESHKFPQFP